MPRPLADESEYQKAKALAAKTTRPEARALLEEKVREFEVMNPQVSSSALGAPVRGAEQDAQKFEARSARRLGAQTRAERRPFVLPGGEQITSVDFDMLDRARGHGKPSVSPNPSDAAAVLENAASEEEMLGDAMVETENLKKRLGPPAGEFVPDGADWKQKLTAEIYEEPTLEQFKAEMASQIPHIDKIGEGDERFQLWREAHARASYESARLNNRPWYRPSKSDDTWATAGSARNAAVAAGLGAVGGASADLHEIPTAAAFGGQEVLDQRAIQEAHPYTAWPGRLLGTFGVGGVPSVATMLGKGGLRVAEKIIPRAVTGGARSAIKAGVAGAGAAVAEERVRDTAQATAEEIGDVGDGFEGLEPLGAFDAQNALLGGGLGVGLDAMGQIAKKSGESYLHRNTSPQRELRNFRDAGGELGPLGGVREPPRLRELERELMENYKPGERPVDVDAHITESIKDPMLQGEFEVDQALKSQLESEKVAYQRAHPRAEVNLKPMVEHAFEQMRLRTDSIKGGDEAFVGGGEVQRVFRDNFDKMSSTLPARDQPTALALARQRGGIVKTAPEMVEAGLKPKAKYNVIVPHRADVDKLERIIGRIDDEAGFARVKGAPDGPWLDWARVVRETRDTLPDDYSGLMAQHDEALVGARQRRERAGLPSNLRDKGGEPFLETPQAERFENSIGAYGTGGQKPATAQALREIAASSKVPLGADQALSIAGELEMLKASQWGKSLRVAEHKALPWADSMMSSIKYGLPALRYRAQPMIEALGAEQAPLSDPLKALLRRMRSGAPKPDPYRALKPRMGGMSLRGGVSGVRAISAAEGPGESEPGGELSREDLENLAKLLAVVQEDQP